MPENDDVLDEFANMSLLLLSWILEHQDGPAPRERAADVVDQETFTVARILSEHLLKHAEQRGARRPAPAVIREKFASLISAGCRTTNSGGYTLEASRNKNCVIGYENKTPAHKCLIPAKLPPGVENW